MTFIVHLLCVRHGAHLLVHVNLWGGCYYPCFLGAAVETQTGGLGGSAEAETEAGLPRALVCVHGCVRVCGDT